MRFGYILSTEEYAPVQLVERAVLAEGSDLEVHVAALREIGHPAAGSSA